jgi:predicted nucleic acid-binding protein
VRIFLDSSMALAAALSETGASRLVFDLAAAQGWMLVVSPWVLREIRDNLANKPPDATQAWLALSHQGFRRG